MSDVTGVWLEERFPELSLLADPASPDDAFLDFFLRQQAGARRGFLPVTAGESFDPAEAKRLWPALRAEFYDLLCTDSPHYADLRKRFTERSPGSDGIVLSAITAAIAAVLGAAAATLVPLVALCAYAAIRLGAGAYCRVAAPPAAP